MQIGAVNSVSFGNSVEKPEIDADLIERVHSIKESCDILEITNTPKKKGPIKAAGSLAVAGITTFLFGKALAMSAEKLAPDLSGFVSKCAGTLTNAASKGLGNLSTTLSEKDNGFAKTAGRVFKAVSKTLSRAIQEVQPEKIEVEEKTAQKVGEVISEAAQKVGEATAEADKKALTHELKPKTFNNIGGVIGTLYVGENVVTADGNEDGVKDIFQEGENAYVAAKDKMGAVGTLVSALT